MRKRSRYGLGLFAGEPIKKGEFIIEYVGERISHEEADRRGGRYLFEINRKITIDGKARSNTARYINHSCVPNSEIEIKKERILVVALKPIPKGEELTYDYDTEYFNEYLKGKCHCPKCTRKKEKLLQKSKKA